MSEIIVRPAYGRVRDIAIYTGAGERTIRDWLKEGLPHIRVRGGKILIKFEDIDHWLSQWKTSIDRAGRIVDLMIKEMLHA
jgi:excisionase family DNA binding protein